jgi:peptide/nickel transport system substrate-binding protein
MLRARKRGSGRGRGALSAGCAAAGLAVILAACGPVSAGSSSAGTTPTSGGTATYATLPGFPANYIFPFDDFNYFNVSNINDFQYLLYRPLYWFGDGAKPYLNNALSLAYPPTYSGQQVTIKLKSYRWSNGDPVTAQDVIFWINMMRAEDGIGGWAGYVQGDFPDDVTGVHAAGTSTVVMTIKGPFSEDWFTYNELSQITPMPLEWDRTSATAKSDCEHVIQDCKAVWTYLDSQSTKMSTWASSPIWSIVDGPWRVTGTTGQGTVTMSINKSYSGALPAHHISNFVLEPFTSEQAEFNVLQDPQGNQRVDVGYLPTVDAPVPPPGAQTGGNPVSLTGYKLSVVYPWQLTYFPYNYNDPTAGPIFHQLYFRQAFQSLVDQEGVIDGPMHGYGKPTIGPVGSYPVTNYLSPQVRAAGDQWELNPTYARTLLQDNGWRIGANGIQTCQSPGTGTGHCGTSVPRGAQLSFTLDYATGVDWMYSSVKEMVSNASLIGIHIRPVGMSATDVTSYAFCLPAPGVSCPSWQLAQWGAWTYAPDYLPTGEELFEKSSASDAGGYNDITNNSLITKTLTARTTAALYTALYKWENYLAGQLPVVYEPNVPQLIESANNLHIGVQDPTLNITPEDWYFLK